MGAWSENHQAIKIRQQSRVLTENSLIIRHNGRVMRTTREQMLPSAPLAGSALRQHAGTMLICGKALLALALLGGCMGANATNDMALTADETTARPVVAADEHTIIFEFGVGIDGPTKRLATTNSTTSLPSSENPDYMRHLARQKLAESQRKSDAPYRIAEHYNAGLSSASDAAEYPRILPIETVPPAELTKRRYTSEGHTAPTVLQIIQRR